MQTAARAGGAPHGPRSMHDRHGRVISAAGQNETGQAWARQDKA
jgi:hypothetical protein